MHANKISIFCKDTIDTSGAKEHWVGTHVTGTGVVSNASMLEEVLRIVTEKAHNGL